MNSLLDQVEYRGSRRGTGVPRIESRLELLHEDPWMLAEPRLGRCRDGPLGSLMAIEEQKAFVPRNEELEGEVVRLLCELQFDLADVVLCRAGILEDESRQISAHEFGGRYRESPEDRLQSFNGRGWIPRLPEHISLMDLGPVESAQLENRGPGRLGRPFEVPSPAIRKHIWDDPCVAELLQQLKLSCSYQSIGIHLLEGLVVRLFAAAEAHFGQPLTLSEVVAFPADGFFALRTRSQCLAQGDLTCADAARNRLTGVIPVDVGVLVADGAVIDREIPSCHRSGDDGVPEILMGSRAICQSGGMAVQTVPSEIGLHPGRSRHGHGTVVDELGATGHVTAVDRIVDGGPGGRRCARLRGLRPPPPALEAILIPMAGPELFRRHGVFADGTGLDHVENSNGPLP